MREATITPQEAVEILRDCGMKIGPEALREGLLQGAFPFGTAIRLQTVRCWVYPKKLEEWISEYLKDDTQKAKEGA